MENEALLERLKNIRRLLGLTQKEFGERMGMALTTWASIEQGRNALNERAKILLQHIYNVNPRYLERGLKPVFLDPEVMASNSIMFSEAPPPDERTQESQEFYSLKMRSNLRTPKAAFSRSFPEREENIRPPEENSLNEVFRFPCPSCEEKEEEIRALRNTIRRLEREIEHQRRIIEYLMESGRPQDSSLNKPGS